MSQDAGIVTNMEIAGLSALTALMLATSADYAPIFGVSLACAASTFIAQYLFAGNEAAGSQIVGTATFIASSAYLFGGVPWLAAGGYVTGTFLYQYALVVV